MLKFIVAEVVLNGSNALLKYLAVPVVNIVDFNQRRFGSLKNFNLTLRLNLRDIALLKLFFEDRFTVIENRIC